MKKKATWKATLVAGLFFLVFWNAVTGLWFYTGVVSTQQNWVVWDKQIFLLGFPVYCVDETNGQSIPPWNKRFWNYNTASWYITVKF